MVAWLAAAAPLVGAAIDALSGERSARKTRKHTRGVATDEAFGSVAGRVEAAKAAGLHPLAALGTPSSSGMSAGGGLTDFRGAISDATNSYTQQRQWKAEQDYARAQNLENKRANQIMMDREDARLKLEAARVTSQNAVDQEQIRASQEESLRRNLAATKGVPVPIRPKPGKSTPHMYVDVIDRFGNTVKIPNPEIYDLELPSLVGAGTLAIPEIDSSGIWQTLKQKYRDFQQQGRQLRAMDPKLNPYRLPTPIGD